MDRISVVERRGREHPGEPLAPERLSVLCATAHHHARRVAAWVRDAGTDLEDVRQALILAAWSRIAQFDPERASWSTFVDLVVRHAAWDLTARARQRRAFMAGSLDDDNGPVCPDGSRARRDVTTGAESEGDAGAAPAGAFAELELAVDVERTVEGLPDHLRRLCRLLQLEPPAVAQRLSGLSPAEFYRQVHDLRMRFRSAGLRL